MSVKWYGLHWSNSPDAIWDKQNILLCPPESSTNVAAYDRYLSVYRIEGSGAISQLRPVISCGPDLDVNVTCTECSVVVTTYNNRTGIWHSRALRADRLDEALDAVLAALDELAGEIAPAPGAPQIGPCAGVRDERILHTHTA